MHRPLTELTVQNLPFANEGQQYDCWDATLPRFGLRIGKRTKTFILNAGKRRVTLGRYGVVTLKQARDEARRRIGMKYLPRTSPHAPGAAQWYLDAIKSEKKPSTINAYSIYLQRIPGLPLHELDPPNLYAALPKGKGAANLCFSTFKAFLSWCVERGHIESNPLLQRKAPNKLRSRDRLLTDTEIAAIWAESYGHGNFGRLFRISILAGQRTGQWKQYQILDGNIVFPPSSMKGTVEHIIPFTQALKSELGAFTPLAQYKPELTKLREALPQIKDFRPHDTRRFLSSTMSKLKVPIDITETILAHKTGSRSQIQRVYDRDARIPQMRDALEKYHTHLHTIGCTALVPEGA